MLFKKWEKYWLECLLIYIRTICYSISTLIQTGKDKKLKTNYMQSANLWRD